MHTDVHRCHQSEPNISIRDFTGEDIFTDVEEAIQCHGSTQLSAVVYRNTLRPDLGPLIRIRRSTRFRWREVVDYNECDYDYSLRDFMAARGRPAWYQDLVHLIAIESDRAARLIALKLLHHKHTGTPRNELKQLYPKFLNSFGLQPRWLEDYEIFLPHSVTPYKSSIIQRSLKCMHCHSECRKGVSLPCSAKHIIHWDCLIQMCHHVDPEQLACQTCQTRIFQNPEHINKLKFNVHADGTCFNDDRLSRWENFEKSCSDLDSTRAATNEGYITISRDFMIDLWQKMVDSGIDASSPAHLWFDKSDEYILLEWEIDLQFTRLEGVRTGIWVFERWIKRRVFFRFRREFLKSRLERGLSAGEAAKMNRHEFMRKILRPGWRHIAREMNLATLLAHYFMLFLAAFSIFCTIPT
ncbi:hypothetical protein BST61_g6888 [Cercospora zeina]